MAPAGILLIFLFISFNSMAQGIEIKEPPPTAPSSWEEFQIFLPDTIKKIEFVEEEGTGEPLEWELSEDGTVILLHNYDGKAKVKVGFVSAAGKAAEFIKASCHIHPKPPS